ncbi:HEAT repeat domain-containing protein [Clostridium sp. A1-XYC3]|uniref:HEAT repeat domain-containing protein n=1 Tax=Clostridium tanneri TaxID=3037988 RepID=A0ABU4JP80_9CLOT|nr:HEAT repeat domain-containing protein [Clostridium sp. A1-XYC3]MDW8799930.1 HEAT repeat domain-containing protein [Clostridium sp. A1-XYC3]
MLNIEWSEIDNYTEEDITYFLFIEGKSIDSLCKIRNLNRETIQKHILDGKIKYGILAKSSNEKELFESISRSGKLDKVEVLKCLDESSKKKLINYIRTNYGDMKTKEKENAVWILGEVGDKEVLNVLIKACVHNHVNVRRMAVSAAGKIGDSAMEPIALKALEDINPQVVMYAIKTLIKLRSKKAEEKIKEICRKTEKEYIKKAAEEYFDIIGNEEMKIGN